jgi:hypothetical protein
MNLQQVPRYQKSDNVINHKITSEYKSIEKILNLIPKAPLLDIACAEGFLVWMADRAGFTQTLGVEIDEGRVLRGRKHLGVNLRANDIYSHLDIIKEFEIFIISRFFHNVGYEKTVKLMDAINEADDYLLIIKHKPGARKETGAKREPLATRKGINDMLDEYPVEKKSFPGDVILAGRGKYSDVPIMLRKYLPEPA